VDEAEYRNALVRNLEAGDVITFFGGAHRTVKYSVPSSVDPVYLIGFEEGDPEQIAKGPDDRVLLVKKAT
jgi:hypothetical protein